MLDFSVKNVRLGVSFSFFAVVGLVCFVQGDMKDNIMLILCCCVMHELGHIIAMTLCSVPPEKIVAYGGGIKICPNRSVMLPDIRSIVILLAGCAVNLIAALAGYLVCGQPTRFVSANLFLGLFNLLPMKYFDGGQVLEILIGGTKLFDFVRICFVAVVGLLLIVMFSNGFFSLSLTVTFLYIAISEFL